MRKIEIDNSDVVILELLKDEAVKFSKGKNTNFVIRDVRDNTVDNFEWSSAIQHDPRPHDYYYTVIISDIEHSGVINYSAEDQLILYQVFRIFYFPEYKNEPEYLLKLNYIKERIVRAIKLKTLTEQYYLNFTTISACFPQEFSKYANSSSCINPKGSYIFPKPPKNKKSKSTDYSILQLIKDFQNYPVYINLDESSNYGIQYDIIECVTNNKDIIEEVKGEWLKLWGTVLHVSRLNVYLTYQTTVKVRIPENQYITESELPLTTSKNICIVKDGFLWLKKMLARIPKELYDKLVSVGCEVSIIDELEDDVVECIIYLNTLPMLSYSEFDSKKRNLSTNSVNYILSNIAISFVRKLITYSEEETEDDKAKFFSNLGIDLNRMYYRPDYNCSKDSEDIGGDELSTTTTNTSKFRSSYVGLSATRMIAKCAKNYVETGSSGYGYLDDLVKAAKSGETSLWEIYIDLLSKQATIKLERVIDRFYQLVMSEDRSTSTYFKIKELGDKEGYLISTDRYITKIPYCSYKW